MKWMLMPLRRYADFTGRSRRMEYWMWALFNVIVALIITIPLTLVTFNALRHVEENGGVRYRSDYGSSTDRFGADRPRSEPANGSGRNSEQDKPPQNDDWSANPAPDATEDPSTDTDNGSTGTSDKVSSRGPAPAVGGGILAYSRNVDYGAGTYADIDPFMFFRAFGPVGWALFSLSCLWGLITFIPNLAVSIRRLHDTDRSGWWLLIGMVPLVGFIILFVFLLTEGTRGPNRFGADPKAADVDRTFD